MAIMRTRSALRTEFASASECAGQGDEVSVGNGRNADTRRARVKGLVG